MHRYSLMNRKQKPYWYRLSFLHGNYLTLTNMGEDEFQRVIDQKLSPLFVSVHATDPEVRGRMLGRKGPEAAATGE